MSRRSTAGGCLPRYGSPLRETLELLDLERYRLRLTSAASGGGWIAASSLLDDGGDFVERQMGLSRERWNMDRRDAAVAFMGWYAWGVGGPAVACYILGRRIPDVSPDNVSLRFDGDGYLADVAFNTGRVAVLLPDPAAGHPETTIFADEEEMLGWLRAGLETGMEPLVSLLRERTRVGEAALWGRAADLLAQVFLMVGRDTAHPERYAAQAAAFISDAASPLRGSTRFFVVERDGRCETFLTRGVCCRAYRNPERGYCSTCPILPQEERERLARESMARG